MVYSSLDEPWGTRLPLILAEFERDAEEFMSALSLEYYLHSAGLKDTLDLTPIYRRFRHLFTIENYHELPAVCPDPKYLRFLQEFVASAIMEDTVKEYSERIAQAEATTVISWDGREVTYRSAPVVWNNEPDVARRHALNELWRRETWRMNALQRDRQRAMVAKVGDFGFKDYVAMWDTLKALDLPGLAARMSAFLSDTEDLFRASLEEALGRIGLAVEDAWKADVGWLFRAPQFDQYFRKEVMVESLRRTLLDLGIRLEEQTNVKLDIEARPKKSPRAFCAPVRIPSDVRLVIMPQGGSSDYDSLFHEAGHTEHFAHVDPALPFAYRWLGDNSVTEGYAFAIEYIASDPVWLRRMLHFDSPQPYLWLSALNKLYMLRRYSTKLLYEPMLHRASDPEEMAEVYADLFTRHLLVRYFPEEYLKDVDDAFYAAQYVRAWTFEGQLRQYLVKEFEEDWFRNRRAGQFLVELWRDGQKYTPEELLRFMGYDGFDLGPVVAEIRQRLAS